MKLRSSRSAGEFVRLNRAPDDRPSWEALMTRTAYWGVDFHARMQTIAYCDTANGEIQLAQLDHRKHDVRNFYSRLTGQVIVGLEAGGLTAPGLKRCSKNLAIRCGQGTLPRFGDEQTGDRRTIVGMPS